MAVVSEELNGASSTILLVVVVLFGFGFGLWFVLVCCCWVWWVFFVLCVVIYNFALFVSVSIL